MGGGTGELPGGGCGILLGFTAGGGGGGPIFTVGWGGGGGATGGGPIGAMCNKGI